MGGLEEGDRDRIGLGNGKASGLGMAEAILLERMDVLEMGVVTSVGTTFSCRTDSCKE